MAAAVRGSNFEKIKVSLFWSLRSETKLTGSSLKEEVSSLRGAVSFEIQSSTFSFFAEGFLW